MCSIKATLLLFSELSVLPLTLPSSSGKLTFFSFEGRVFFTEASSVAVIVEVLLAICYSWRLLCWTALTCCCLDAAWPLPCSISVNVLSVFYRKENWSRDQECILVNWDLSQGVLYLRSTNVQKKVWFWDIHLLVQLNTKYWMIWEWRGLRMEQHH